MLNFKFRLKEKKLDLTLNLLPSLCMRQTGKIDRRHIFQCLIQLYVDTGTVPELKIDSAKCFQTKEIVSNVLNILQKIGFYAAISQKSTVHLHPLHPLYEAPEIISFVFFLFRNFQSVFIRFFQHLPGSMNLWYKNHTSSHKNWLKLFNIA